MTQPYDEEQSQAYQPTQVGPVTPAQGYPGGYGPADQPQTLDQPVAAYPATSYPMSPAPSPGGSSAPGGGVPQWVLAIALIAVLAAIGTVSYFVVNAMSDSGDQRADPPAQSGPVTVTHTESGSPAPDTGVPNTGGEERTTARTEAPTADASVTVAGADERGFYGQPRCNVAEDPAIFIGRTDRSQVVICQVGAQTGRYYYRGMADGKLIEVSYPVRSGSTFTATNGAVQYIVSPSSLIITENGRTLTTEPMRESWLR